MPYWLRGGVIGGGVTIVSTAVLLACDFYLTLVFSEVGFACMPLTVISPLLPFFLLWDLNPFFHDLPGLLLPLLGAICWFLVGALLGFIVGLIKKRAHQ